MNCEFYYYLKVCVETNNKGINGAKEEETFYICFNYFFAIAYPIEKQTISAPYREEIVLISENLTKVLSL